MQSRSIRYAFGTSRRLALGFGALVLLIAAASAVALAGSARIHDGLAETKRREEGVRLSLELASAVRDQYAHQALSRPASCPRCAWPESCCWTFAISMR